LAPSGVLTNRGQDVAFVLQTRGSYKMALLKSKVAKAAAATDAARLLSANPEDAQATQGSSADWSIAQLSAIYTEHRTQLVSQARRITRDEAEANEVVQEAFLKFMLAAPDLDTADRAIAYLRTSVTNLALNVIRARGARPNLVAIDADTTQERLNEIASENHIDLDTTITAAEDAAIIREALARLTPDQRTALVMWEMEGRTTEEIAAALNTTPANVRHILVRARKSMVRVLEEWIVDEKTGLTALNALSTTYKKAAELAQKSSKAALSLLLVITAFLGFNSMTGNESPVLPVVAQVETETSPMSPVAPSASASASASAPAATPSKTAKSNVSGVNAKQAKLAFVGLDKDGVPTGFTITDAGSISGTARLTRTPATVSNTGLVLNNQFLTATVGPNILLNQKVTVDGAGTRYEVLGLSLGYVGNWMPTDVANTVTEMERLANGNWLVTATFTVDSILESDFLIPVGNRGYDLIDQPTSVTTRILLNSGKSQILAQAVLIADAKKGGM
jgi:RNA polymerase sigma factor (sigma-70 family)